MLDADRGRGRALLGAALLLALLRHDMAPSSASALHSISPRSHPVREEPAVANTPPPVAPAPPEDVLWTGCTEVKLSPSGEPRVCTFIDQGTTESVSLRVWLPSRVSEPVVALDGTPVVAIDAARVDDGWSLVVQPGHGGHLTVSGRVGAEQAEQTLLSFAVEFRPRADKELRVELDAAVGKPKAQRALAQRLRERLHGETSPPQRLLLTQYLQYVTYDLGDHRDAVALAKEAVTLARALGQPLAECGNVWSAAFTAGERLGDPSAALELLHDACRHHDSIPTIAMMGAYYQGLFERGQGRFTAARQSFQRSAQIARRLRWLRWEIFVLDPLIDVLAMQGRFGWARQVLERSRELDAVERSSGLLDRCESQAGYHQRLGELLHREAELTGRDPSVAHEHWRRAQTILRDRARCPEHPSVVVHAATIELELARAAARAGELDRAADMLQAIPHDGIIPILDVRRRLLWAELELARGDRKAAARMLQDLDTETRRGKLARAFQPEEQWHFHLAWARLHQDRGNLPEALESLARAQAQLGVERHSLGSETDRQAAMRRKSSEQLVRLLLDQGLERQALCAARIARARGLVSLAPVPEHARESLQAVERTRAALFEGYEWYDPRDIPIDERMKVEAGRGELEAALPARPEPIECDQLPVAQPGEASLLYFHDGRGYVGFGWGPEGHVVTWRLSAWSEGRAPASVGEALITPFASVLEGATRLRVLAPAAMHELSFADLPWRGRPLGDTLAVAHALDLPRVPLEDRREGTAALVFSDPNKRLMDRYGDLAGRFEQWRVALEEHDRLVTYMKPPLVVAGHASVGRILEGTRGVDLALLYGFGAVRSSYYDQLSTGRPQHEADRDGFGVGLDVLARSDILLQAGKVPRYVILAHCDSATIDVYGVSGAVGMAQSYVQAGAEWALGAVGDVAPESMEVIVDTVLDAMSQGTGVADVSVALQLAKRRLHAQGLSGADQLRLWIP